MSVLPDPLLAVRTAIQTGDKAHARDLLREILKTSPTADAWFLAAQVATSREQCVRFLEKAVEVDPFHDGASATLDRMKNHQLAIPNRRRRQPQQMRSVEPTLLQDTVAVFLEYDWDLKIQTSTTAQLEKKNGVSTVGALLLIALLSLLGMLIIFGAIATARKERVTLRLQDSGALRVMTSEGSYNIRYPGDVDWIANTNSSGITYGGALVAGIIAAAIWYVIL